MSVNPRSEDTGLPCSPLPTHCWQRARWTFADVTECVTRHWVVQPSSSLNPRLQPSHKPSLWLLQGGVLAYRARSPTTNYLCSSEVPKVCLVSSLSSWGQGPRPWSLLVYCALSLPSYWAEFCQPVPCYLHGGTWEPATQCACIGRGMCFDNPGSPRGPLRLPVETGPRQSHVKVRPDLGSSDSAQRPLSYQVL